ncbi:helix-turn-helix domain-containing protein [Magnetococcales bacterium HHB-1]
MAKRNLFTEISQSLKDVQNYDAGKVALKTTDIEEHSPLQIDADTIIKTRESLALSQGVFAHWLRVSLRTLERWEQGRDAPNAQAAALILMIRKYPDTIERLASI